MAKGAKHVLFTLVLIIGVMSCLSPQKVSSAVSTSGVALRWDPPALNDPKTIRLGTGYTLTKLDPSRDYIVKLPPTKKVGGTVLVGGHNIVVIGGAITIPTGTSSDTERRGIYIKNATGTVHIEGVLIDGSGGAEFDGIDIAAPRAIVQLQRIRIIGVRGGYNTFHGDLVQPWGGVKDLRIDRLTGRSNYQGLMLQPQLGPIGSAEISHVDITSTPSKEPRQLAGGHMLWLTPGSTSCEGFPTRLSQVFVKPRAGRTLGGSVWPPSNSSLPCRAHARRVATWPSLPVTGWVTNGRPAKRFVPKGAAGIGYPRSGQLQPLG